MNKQDLKKLWKETGKPLTLKEFRDNQFWKDYKQNQDFFESLTKKDWKVFLKKAIKGSTIIKEV